MGIDFSHCDASWSYGGFHEARSKLARAIGIVLEDMYGFGPAGKPWSEVKDDVKPLLNHSDCDGELTVSECRQVAPRLREIVSQWPENDIDRQRFEELANGMEAAADDNEPLQFT